MMVISDRGDSLKEGHALHLPSERYSPVRRASDGLTSLHKYQSHLEKLYQQTVSGGPSVTSSLKQLQNDFRELQVKHTRSRMKMKKKI